MRVFNTESRLIRCKNKCNSTKIPLGIFFHTPHGLWGFFLHLIIFHIVYTPVCNLLLFHRSISHAAIQAHACVFTTSSYMKISDILYLIHTSSPSF